MLEIFVPWRRFVAQKKNKIALCQHHSGTSFSLKPEMSKQAPLLPEWLVNAVKFHPALSQNFFLKT